jgi:DEAD/DEAH box helicase domain-containing protein
VGKSAVFFYDGHSGGVGLCASVFDQMERLLAATLDLVSACDCGEGCPSCVHSPKCGSGNRPLDKRGALRVMELLLGRRALTAAPREGAKEPPAHSQVRSPVPEAPRALGRRVLFLDLETQRSAEEVGGWHNAHLMRLAVAVIYDTMEDRFETYPEADVHRLIKRLRGADLVVGFNVTRFDYAVLRGYTSEDLGSIPTFDLLSDLHAKLGFRLSLAHLAAQTLGTEKSGNGLESLRWWKEGLVDRVTQYCRRDVEITRQLFEHGARERHIIFQTREGRRVRLPVAWDVEEILGAGPGRLAR